MAIGSLPLVLLPSLLVLYIASRLFYNLVLHPFRSYPGPLLWRATSLPYDWYTFQGTLHDQVVRLHRQYGPTVRLAPNEISFTSSQARKDILAHVPGREEFPKDLSRITMPPNGFESILASHKENHARFRRLLSHAFSEKGLRDQEPHIARHVDLLVENLTKRAAAGEEIDIVDWYSMVTFDLIGNLAFGQSFGCLENGGVLHPWVPGVSASVKFSVQTSLFREWGVGFLSKFLMDAKTIQGRVSNFLYAQGSVKKRLEHGADRGDFWDRILIKSEKNEETGEGMSPGEQLNNAVVLVLGGSETSATALSGATYLLLKHPEILKKLTKEVRSAFKRTEDITIHSVLPLAYMHAVLEETMRLYPPVPQQQVRSAPPSGGKVLDQYVPAGTTVNPHQLASNRMEWNFHRPDDFVPERWLTGADALAEFSRDDKASFQPFSLGARNCIGRNLAWAEMKLILAKILYHFDLSENRSNDDKWLEQKAWGVRAKEPVWVKLTSAAKS